MAEATTVNWSHDRHATGGDIWTVHDSVRDQAGWEQGMKLTLSINSEFGRVTVTGWRMRMCTRLGGMTEKHTDELEFLFFGAGREENAVAIVTSVMNADTIPDAYAAAESLARLREL